MAAAGGGSGSILRAILGQGISDSPLGWMNLLRSEPVTHASVQEDGDYLQVQRKLGMGLVLLIVLIGDRLSKHWIEQQLVLGETRPVVSGVFSLTLVYNPGGAFGFLAGYRWVFVVAALLLLLLLFLHRNTVSEQTTTVHYGLAVLTGGVLGNLWDRIVFGYVVDFFDFHIWPVFNVADAAIVCGALVLGWEVLRHERRTKSQ